MRSSVVAITLIAAAAVGVSIYSYVAARREAAAAQPADALAADANDHPTGVPRPTGYDDESEPVSAPVAAPASESAPASASAAGATPPRPVSGFAGNAAQRKQEVIARSKARLAMFADPAQRESFLQEKIRNFTKNTRGMGDIIGIGADVHEQLIRLLADQALASELSTHRCMIDPACEFEGMRLGREQMQRAEVDNLIGIDKHALLDTYMQVMPERMDARQLQTHLMGSPEAIPDSQVEQLAAAVAIERRAMRGVVSYTSQSSVITPAFPLPLPRNDSGTALRIAREYNRRVIARAETVLNAEQLIEYRRRREGELIILERTLTGQGR